MIQLEAATMLLTALIIAFTFFLGLALGIIIGGSVERPEEER